MGHSDSPPPKGENRISDAKRRIMDEFRLEGQLWSEGKLPSVSGMGYTVSITDVDGERIEVVKNGSVSEIFDLLLPTGIEPKSIATIKPYVQFTLTL